MEGEATLIPGKPQEAGSSDGASGEDLYSTLALAQGAFFVLTGVWPLLHMRSFLKATGPKNDLWLVKTVGLLVAVIGGVIGTAGYRKQKSMEIPLLAVGSSLGLAAVDVVYVWKKVILPVYLLDALAEMGLVACWAYVLKQMANEELS